MRKKRISLFLSLCLLLSLCAVPAGAAGAEGSSPFVCEPQTGGFSVITDYVGDGEETLVIPAAVDGAAIVGVSHIFDTPLPAVRRLVFADGIRMIGGLGLGNLPNLDEIVLPSTLKMIDGGAFRGAAVETITIPASVALMVGMDEGERYCAPPFERTVTLRGDRGSYAQNYAAANGLRFEEITYTVSVGDVNADGVCNSTDARLILQRAVGKVALDAHAADVSGDGAVDSIDARLCLQHTVGSITIDTVTAPTRRATSSLVSAEAAVYAKSFPRDNLALALPAYEYAAVGAAREAIAITNTMATNAFTCREHALETVSAFCMDFIEPDGTKLQLQYRAHGEFVAVYCGWVIGNFGTLTGFEDLAGLLTGRIS